MSVPLSPGEFAALRELIHQLSGIQLGPDKAYLIQHRLERLLAPHGCRTFGELHAKARAGHKHGELCLDIMDAISINETFWFRDPRLFNLLKERIFPELLAQIEDGRRERINIWSAACATGQEPYSLAMTALDFFAAHGGDQVCRKNVRILATDISRHSLALAQRGIYKGLEMTRGLPEGCLGRYFLKDGEGWSLRDSARSLVEFKRQNLREPLAGLGTFDLVALRNVIIYFSDEVKRELFGRLVSVMAPGAYLFLGTGEAVAFYSRSFEVMEFQGLNIYRLPPRPGGK